MTATVMHRHGQRELNSEQILRALLREGALSRVELAQQTGLTTAAISKITRELIEGNMLREIGPAHTGRVGATAILLDFPLDVPVFGVIHQAVTTLHIGLCNLRGQVLARRVLATPQPYRPEWAIRTVGQQLRELLATLGFSEQSLIGIGAGLSGLVQHESGIVKRAPSMGWEQVPFQTLLAQDFACPIVIENNVRGMAFGEALFGSGRLWSDFVFVYLGIGIGSGLIIQGQPYRGAHDGAGEIGHITVEANGDLCACGNRGCLETTLAEPAIARYACQCGIQFTASADAPKQRVYELVDYAARGDSTAQAVVVHCGKALGTALANLIDLFNPGHIVLHGTLTLAGDLFSSSVASCIQQRAFLARDEVVQLLPPTFGDDAGLVGAAAIAFDTFIFAGGLRQLPALEGR